MSQSQQFTASVPGGGAATWTVDGIAGGNSTVGTVSSSGLYVAPGTAGTHTVLATSVANPTQSGSAAVAVTDLKGVYTYHVDLARTGDALTCAEERHYGDPKQTFLHKNLPFESALIAA